MRYLFLCWSMLFVGACSLQNKTDLTQYDYCLTEKAQQAIASDTISAGPLKSTVKQMVLACVPNSDQTPEITQHAKELLIRLLQDEV